MARIAGVDIPNDKPVAYSLAYIYGIGIPTGKKICTDAKVDPTKRVKDLTEAELTAIRSKVAEYKVEGDLRREVNLNIKRLQVAIAEFVTSVVYHAVANKQRPMHVQSKVHVRQSLTRKRLSCNRRTHHG